MQKLTDREDVSELKFHIAETAVPNVRFNVFCTGTVAYAQLCALWLTVGVLQCHFTHLETATS